MKLLDQILPQVALADEKTLYTILRFVGRKKRREVLKSFSEVIDGKSGLLVGQPEKTQSAVKDKFQVILKHYGYKEKGKKRI